MPSRVRTTTVPDVKAACVAALQRALPDVQVTYGVPGGNVRVDSVFVGNGELDDDWAALGNNTREENFTLDLEIFVRRDGGSQQEATEAAFALLRVADEALTGNRDLLAATTAGWVLVKYRRFVEGFDDNARATHLSAGIRVYAYL